MKKSNRNVSEFFERQRTSSAELEDPEALIRAIARCVVEALAGARDIEQIARWLNEDVYRTLQTRIEMAERARAAASRKAQRPNPILGTVHITEPCDGVVESVVVVRTRARARAVAIRLEGWDRRWRASSIAVL